MCGTVDLPYIAKWAIVRLLRIESLHRDLGLDTIQSILSLLNGQPKLRFFEREQQVLS